MLDSTNIGVLALVAVTLFIFYIWNKIILRKDAATVQKYKLYKIRDELTNLVAEDKLPEDGFLFQTFYIVTNHLIRQTKQALCLKTFLHAMRSAEAEGIDPADSAVLSKVITEVRHENPEVAKTLVGFFQTVNEILLENSVVVRVFFRWKIFRDIYRRISKWPRLLTSLFSSQAYASRLYRRYDKAGQEFSRAA